MKRNFIIPAGTLFAGMALGLFVAKTPMTSGRHAVTPMQVHYLEIVTSDVDSVIAAFGAALDVEFGEPVAQLGGARTAPLAGGGLVGVRGPLRETEDPVVRPYWLVPDAGAAHDAAIRAGGQMAHPPLELPGYGTFVIYHQGGNDHGLWQLPFQGNSE